MTPELKAFLQSYKDWRKSGAPDEMPFSRGTGLCGNTARIPGITERGITKLTLELNVVLPVVQGSPGLPFNKFDLYYEESAKNECHLNRRRIAWVNKQLNQEE